MAGAGDALDRPDAAFPGGSRAAPVDGATLWYNARTPVNEIMSRPPVTISLDATLGEARDLMVRRRVHHLLVFENSTFLGVLSDQDLLQHLSSNIGTLAETSRDSGTLKRRVLRATTYRPVTIQPSAPILDAAALLLRHQISCLPVQAAGGSIVGVVTTRDLLRALLG